MNRRRAAEVAGVLVAVTGCRARAPTCPPSEVWTPPPPSQMQPPLGPPAADLDPCIDFHAYACTPWMEATVIDEDRSIASPYQQAATEVERELRAVLEGDGPGGPLVDPARRAYAQCMETSATALAEVVLPEPLGSALDRVQDPETFLFAAGLLLAHGITSVFSVQVATDLEDLGRQALYFDQRGTGLPEARLLDQADQQGQRVRAPYQARIERALKVRGMDSTTAAALADEVLAMEQRLAAAHTPRTESYVRWRSDALDDPWREQVAQIFGRAMSIETMVVYYGSVRYLSALEEIVASTRPEVLRAYLEWHLARGLARWQPEDPWPRDVETILDGRPAPPLRWRRCVLTVHRAFEALTSVVGERISPPEARAEASRIAAMVRQTLRARIARAPGLKRAVREHAGGKIDALGVRMGPPWLGDGSVEEQATNVGAGRSEVESADGWLVDALRLEASRFERTRDRARGTIAEDPLTRDAFSTVAHYHWVDNEVMVGLPLLHASLFDPSQDLSRTMGLLGFGVAHEMGHAVGPQNIAAGPRGPFAYEWAVAPVWARAECVGDVYQQLDVPLPLDDYDRYDEAVADRIGLSVAESAYAEQRGGAACLEPDDAGLRLMYLSMAQSMCAKVRPQQQRGSLIDDEHSPRAARVNATVRGRPLFSRAFGCEAESPLGAGPSCEVW